MSKLWVYFWILRYLLIFSTYTWKTKTYLNSCHDIRRGDSGQQHPGVSHKHPHSHPPHNQPLQFEQRCRKSRKITSLFKCCVIQLFVIRNNTSKDYDTMIHTEGTTSLVPIHTEVHPPTGSLLHVSPQCFSLSLPLISPLT